jgi:YNFM family putative membrane transporter
MLIGATLGLGLCQAGLALASAWWQMLVLRGLEGLCLPALFTVLMTATARTAAPGRVRHALAWYVATTIVGGFGGRAISGLVAEQWHWRIAFAVWALGLLAAAVLLRREPSGASHFLRPHPRAFLEILAQGGFRYAYLGIFWVFFLFAGFLNVLPFRLRELAPELGAGAIGLAYAGYLVGVAVTLGGETLLRRIGTEPRVLAVGIGLYALALAVFAVPLPAALHLGMFAFCGGMFLIHGRLAGHVNQLARCHQGLVNGLYIAVYYLGGTLGTWTAPLVYRDGGWAGLLILLATALVAAGAALILMLRYPPEPGP